jgi:hypothetical protein
MHAPTPHLHSIDSTEFEMKSCKQVARLSYGVARKQMSGLNSCRVLATITTSLNAAADDDDEIIESNACSNRRANLDG